MAKTLLAVDDSVTMRKVLDITFSGEDFRVVGAENRDAALAKLSEQPNVVVLDTSLGSDDAYALAKEIRSRAPSTTLVLMASRYNPYDANKGRDAGVDEFVDKPFDTQQMIEKVKKAMLARESGAGPAKAAAPAAPTTGTGTAPSIQSPFHATRPTGQGAPAPAPVVAAAPPAPPPAPAPKPAPPAVSRTHTLSFENSPFAAPPAPAPSPAPPVAAAKPAPAPVAAKPAPAPGHAPAPAPAPAAVNGHLAGKLGELGLTQAQADAVLALSREVVERVVWEVVPQLAETIIKEEIARLTKD